MAEPKSNPLSIETLKENVNTAEKAWEDAMETLGGHYLTEKDYVLAEPVYRKLMSHQLLSNPANAGRSMYHLSIALNRQSKFAEAVPILEQYVPIALFRERLANGDPEQWFAQQECGGFREFLIALEGSGDLEYAKYVAKRALEVVGGMREGPRESHLKGLRENSKAFEEIWAEKERMGA